MGVKRLDVRTKKTLQDSIGIEKVTFEETVTELPLPRREKQLLELLKEVAALHREVDEDVRFNEKAVSLLGAGRGVGVGTLWNVAETWLAYLDGRASGVRRKLHADLHERLLDFLRSTGRLPEGHGRRRRFRDARVVGAAARLACGTHNFGR